MLIVENWHCSWLNNYLVADPGLQLRLSSVTLTTVYQKSPIMGGKKSSHGGTVYKNVWATTLKTVNVAENKVSLRNFHSQKEVKEARTRGNEVS